MKRQNDIHTLLRHDGIVACSPIMEHIYENALHAAATDASILIQGGSGTGKDCLAKFIHNHSRCKQMPFIHVNCSAIPEELFEAEIFGYENGAFTGSRPTGKKGLAALADNGTLYLDEIGELALPLQTKLLMLIQDHQILPLGASHPKKVNIRIIAATNRQLKKMVNDRLFRLDLYYRLSVVVFNIPPLRQRSEDILGLIHFLSDKNTQLYGEPKQFSQDALQFLLEQEWPGNIREIQNFMEKLYIMEEASDITAQCLKEKYFFMKMHTEPQAAPKLPILPLKTAVAQFEKDYITEVMQKTASIEEAAEYLGIDTTTIIHKLAN